MSILIWLSLGLVISAVSMYFAPRNSSVLGTFLLGVLGAVLGATLGSVIFNLDHVSLSLPAFVMATAASATLLLIERSIVRT